MILFWSDSKFILEKKKKHFFEFKESFVNTTYFINNTNAQNIHHIETYKTYILLHTSHIYHYTHIYRYI